MGESVNKMMEVLKIESGAGREKSDNELKEENAGKYFDADEMEEN